MFFLKSKKYNKDKKIPIKKTIIPVKLSEKQQILLMIRKMRRRINPDVLNKAEQIAFSQLGKTSPSNNENEASRLFKLAMNNDGARRSEILALVERKVNKRLH